VGSSAETDRSGAGPLARRRTRLEDGRYLIYYTFGEGEAEVAPGVAEAGEDAGAEPAAEPEAVEERRV